MVETEAYQLLSFHLPPAVGHLHTAYLCVESGACQTPLPADSIH